MFRCGSMLDYQRALRREFDLMERVIDLELEKQDVIVERDRAEAELNYYKAIAEAEGRWIELC